MSVVSSLAFGLAQIGQPPTPDVTIAGGNCAASASRIRTRAEALLRQAAASDYRHFPVDRKDLIARMSSTMLTPQAICAALQTPTGATADNHNKLRRMFRDGSITEADARRRGVIASRLPLRSACPENSDWSSSPYFVGVKSCREVASKIDSDRLPAILFAVGEPAREAQAQLQTHAAALHSNRYANGGPVPCGGRDAFHELRVAALLPNLHFILRTFLGKGWAAWMQPRSCSNGNGKSFEAGDLQFSFGMRVFVPVVVSANGQLSEQTLILSTSAAGSASRLASLVPKDTPYQRLLATQCAQKVYLEARKNGWGIKR